MYGLLSLLGIGANLANDARIHNTKVLGTSKDISLGHPERMRNRQACDAIHARVMREKAEREGKL